MCDTAVLLSGGLDSTTALHWALSRPGRVRALAFDYGQRHRVEVRMARFTCRRLGLPLDVLKVDLAAIGGSALTDRAIPVPSVKRFAHSASGPPSTYVPFRNGVFLALAAAWAEANGVRTIVTGFNVIDSPDYPDTRAAFVRAMERTVNLGTRAAFGGPRFRITAPFINKTKAEIIRIGSRLGADYAHAVSCYRGGEAPCGTCSACRLRAKAFREVGIEDPLVVRTRRGKGGQR
jgi:7-cyano-7-deazaguanine synthase